MGPDDEDLKNEQPERYDERRQVLLKYWEKVGGTLYEEVRVGKRGLGAEPRWIDAVRIPDGERRTERFERGVKEEEFKLRISGAEVEVVEAERRLNRGVIGQAMVAKHLLEMEHDGTMAVPIIACGEGDAQLEKVCRVMGIRVWTAKHSFVVPLKPASTK